METTENNKLIAEFMGGISVPNDYINFPVTNGINAMPISKLKYHSSWDWLIPVVEKIESIGRTAVVIGFDTCEIKDENYADLSKNLPDRFDSFNEEGKTKLEATYKAVIEFIKWYNENR